MSAPHDGDRVLGRVDVVTTSGPHRGAGWIDCGARRAAFEPREWCEAAPPRPGDLVTFMWRAGRATRVHRAGPGSSPTSERAEPSRTREPSE